MVSVDLIGKKIGISNINIDALKEINTTNVLTRVELFVPEAQWKAADSSTRELLLGFI